MPGAVLGAEDAAVNTADKILGLDSLMGRWNINKTHS